MKKTTIIDTLRVAPVRSLWAAHGALSAGDEVSYLLLSWTLAACVGRDALWLLIVQAVASIFIGATSGRWSDRHSPKRVIAFVLVLRALSVFALSPNCTSGGAFTLHFMSLIAAIAVARALYEPALQEILPSAAGCETLRHPTNSLIEATRRLAGIVTPIIAGTLALRWGNSAVFAASAAFFVLAFFALLSFKSKTPPDTSVTSGSLAEGWALATKIPDVHFGTLLMATTFCAWAMVYYIAFPLLVHHAFPDRVDAFGLLISIYGISNFISNVAMGFLPMNRSWRWMGFGFLAMGSGFFALAYAKTLLGFALALTVASLGGPIPDLAIYQIVQKHFRGKDLARLYRLRMTIGHAVVLLISSGALVSFPTICPAWIGMVAGSVIVLAGLTALVRDGFVHGASNGLASKSRISFPSRIPPIVNPL